MSEPVRVDAETLDELLALGMHRATQAGGAHGPQAIVDLFGPRRPQALEVHHPVGRRSVGKELEPDRSQFGHRLRPGGVGYPRATV